MPFKELFEKLGGALSQVWDRIEAFPVYQNLKDRFESLDQGLQQKIKLGSIAAGALFAFFMIGQVYWSSLSLKNEWIEKEEILFKLRSATDEVRALQAETSGSLGSQQPWPGFFESKALSSDIDKAQLTVSPETPLKGKWTSVSEMGYEVKLAHVNVKKLVRFAFNLENGGRPVKLRNLKIESKSEPNGVLKGFVDATFVVSVFQNGT